MTTGDSNEPEPDFMALVTAQHHATIAFIAAVAGATPQDAEKALEVSVKQAEEIQTFLGWLADPAQTKDYPIIGLRIHHPPSGGHDKGRGVQYLAPKMLPRLVGGRWVVGRDTDLLAYSATMALLTSIEARAILMLQGYRVEFVQGAWPKDQQSNGKRK